MNRIISMLTRCRPYFPDPEDLYRVFNGMARTKILLFLLKRGESSATEIMLALDMDQTTVYRAVEELVKLGLAKDAGLKARVNGAGRHQIKIWAVKYD